MRFTFQDLYTEHTFLRIQGPPEILPVSTPGHLLTIHQAQAFNVPDRSCFLTDGSAHEKSEPIPKDLTQKNSPAFQPPPRHIRTPFLPW